MGNELRLDAGEKIFFEGQLDKILSEAVMKKYPLIKARSLFPTNIYNEPGVRDIKYRVYSEVGMAKVISNYADDLPRVDVKGEEFSVTPKPLGDSVGWNIFTIQSAKKAGLDLEGMQMTAARNAMLRAENQLAFKGDDNFKLGGFLSNENVPVNTVAADGEGGLTTFESKKTTPTKIIRDVNDLIYSIPTISNGVHFADTLIFPLSQHGILNTVQEEISGLTILEFIRKSYPMIDRIEWVNDLKNPFGDGLDYMVAYERSPEVLSMEILSDFQALEPQRDGLEITVDCVELYAGVVIKYPLAIAFANGI